MTPPTATAAAAGGAQQAWYRDPFAQQTVLVNVLRRMDDGNFEIDDEGNKLEVAATDLFKDNEGKDPFVWK